MEAQAISADYQTGIDDQSVERKHILFERYVTPYTNMIYKLCIKYTFDPQDVEDNYVEVLANFYKYIETYKPEMSIRTWLHIVTKRYIIDADKKRASSRNGDDDIDIDDVCDEIEDEGEISYKAMDINNYRELYSDDIVEALDSLKEIYREALLLQMAGYKLNEIMDISFENGNLKTKNIETVKSRLHLAKKEMRNRISRDGEKISN